jgi:hypothetical protein
MRARSRGKQKYLARKYKWFLADVSEKRMREWKIAPPIKASAAAGNSGMIRKIFPKVNYFRDYYQT